MEALELDFHIGPLEQADKEEPPLPEPPPWEELLAGQAELRVEFARALRGFVPNTEMGVELRHIPLRDIDLAAGAGAVVESEEVVGHLAFSADWLKQRGIDSENASIVRVTGRSMEPTLLEGSSVLVDETRRRRRAGEIFAVRRADGGVVKRLEKDERGRWLLTSDNPRYDPVPWSPDDEIVGQVRWTARVL
ncbi:S24 family peptidase [Candidatus Palauibacter sp.]|uniref:S24 family peptidase n=1 Tax=Candidatus Palauibacter sp. TaxID=3101350 RepID=UPI003CC63C15